MSPEENHDREKPGHVPRLPEDEEDEIILIEEEGYEEELKKSIEDKP
jgi:hypothetical protein